MPKRTEQKQRRVAMAPGTGGKPQVENINVRGIVPRRAADPGDGGAIDVTGSTFTEITTAAAETRTLGDPRYVGQEIVIVFIADGGDCVITAASPVNQAGNNTLTFSDVGELVQLVGKHNLTDGWEWGVIAADGVALSTV